jgi:hypothetical protein
MKIIRNTILFALPTGILIVLCVFCNAGWPYYIISFAVGNGIGVLAVFTAVQIEKCDNKPTIKIKENVEENNGN